ncbi:unnamed protein product [Pleuronectes platessa]|uniref:Uncharacterized protein n=1 Tax=Pleuronectes platessa TaxID=8262 RepID=A0A9N7VU05_PLEPL|nr:unnamed protein product [Pleuronectes platessa]
MPRHPHSFAFTVSHGLSASSAYSAFCSPCSSSPRRCTITCVLSHLHSFLYHYRLPNPHSVVLTLLGALCVTILPPSSLRPARCFTPLITNELHPDQAYFPYVRSLVHTGSLRGAPPYTSTPRARLRRCRGPTAVRRDPVRGSSTNRALSANVQPSESSGDIRPRPSRAFWPSLIGPITPWSFCLTSPRHTQGYYDITGVYADPRLRSRTLPIVGAHRCWTVRMPPDTAVTIRLATFSFILSLSQRKDARKHVYTHLSARLELGSLSPPRPAACTQLSGLTLFTHTPALVTLYSLHSSSSPPHGVAVSGRSHPRIFAKQCEQPPSPTGSTHPTTTSLLACTLKSHSPPLCSCGYTHRYLRHTCADICHCIYTDVQRPTPFAFLSLGCHRFFPMSALAYPESGLRGLPTAPQSWLSSLRHSLTQVFCPLPHRTAASACGTRTRGASGESGVTGAIMLPACIVPVPPLYSPPVPSSPVSFLLHVGSTALFSARPVLTCFQPLATPPQHRAIN